MTSSGYTSPCPARRRHGESSNDASSRLVAARDHWLGGVDGAVLLFFVDVPAA